MFQRAGINYFLFSRELAMIDSLPLSNLFSPDHIADNLALRWTDGTTSLLTWPGAETRPLDDAWVAAYRDAVKNSGSVQSFPVCRDTACVRAILRNAASVETDRVALVDGTALYITCQRLNSLQPEPACCPAMRRSLASIARR